MLHGQPADDVLRQEVKPLFAVRCHSLLQPPVRSPQVVKMAQQHGTSMASCKENVCARQHRLAARQRGSAPLVTEESDTIAARTATASLAMHPSSPHARTHRPGVKAAVERSPVRGEALRVRLIGIGVGALRAAGSVAAMDCARRRGRRVEQTPARQPAVQRQHLERRTACSTQRYARSPTESVCFDACMVRRLALPPYATAVQLRTVAHVWRIHTRGSWRNRRDTRSS